MLLLLCTSAPLVLCCDWFDHGSRWIKRDPVDLVIEDYDIPLCWRIGHLQIFLMTSFAIITSTSL